MMVKIHLTFKARPGYHLPYEAFPDAPSFNNEKSSHLLGAYCGLGTGLNMGMLYMPHLTV